MTLLRSLDLWSCAMIRLNGGEIQQDKLVGEELVWLPPATGFAFRADPFGIWVDGVLHVFVEYFDYRRPKGVIERCSFDGDLGLIETCIALERPWHLSYPFTFGHDGEIWMLPEARKSGRLVLYKATRFPNEWHEAGELEIDPAAVDATPLHYQGRWWLFYGRGGRKLPESMDLNVAFADHFTGPWTAHPLNPVRRGLRSRPAGTPVLREDGRIDLPVQDSETTYGAAVRRLLIHHLDPNHFEAEELPWLQPGEALAPFVDGLHTVSRAGDIALIDCKRVDRSFLGTVAFRQGSRWEKKARSDVPMDRKAPFPDGK